MQRKSNGRFSSLILATVFVGTVLAVLPSGCSGPKDPWEGMGGSPRVATTIPPLACFVRNVAGDQAGIISLCTTLGPHHRVYSAQDVVLLRGADLFLANGLELDDGFADKMHNSSGSQRVRYVKLGERLLKTKGLVDKMGEDEDHDHDAHDKARTEEHHDGHHHGDYDPHLWLGIPQAVCMVECIRDDLKQIDPANAAAYDQRAGTYVKKLKKLHEEGRKALTGKKDDRLIAFHDSLHYFAESFGLKIAGVIEARPGIDADPATMSQLVSLCKNKQVRVIATEPQYQQKSSAMTLLQELKKKGVEDVEMVEVDPLETVAPDDAVDAGWYERKMRENIDKLAKALR